MRLNWQVTTVQLAALLGATVNCSRLRGPASSKMEANLHSVCRLICDLIASIIVLRKEWQGI